MKSLAVRSHSLPEQSSSIFEPRDKQSEKIALPNHRDIKSLTKKSQSLPHYSPHYFKEDLVAEKNEQLCTNHSPTIVITDEAAEEPSDIDCILPMDGIYGITGDDEDDDDINDYSYLTELDDKQTDDEENPVPDENLESDENPEFVENTDSDENTECDEKDRSEEEDKCHREIGFISGECSTVVINDSEESENESVDDSIPSDASVASDEVLDPDCELPIPENEEQVDSDASGDITSDLDDDGTVIECPICHQLFLTCYEIDLHINADQCTVVTNFNIFVKKKLKKHAEEMFETSSASNIDTSTCKDGKSLKTRSLTSSKLLDSSTKSSLAKTLTSRSVSLPGSSSNDPVRLEDIVDPSDLHLYQDCIEHTAASNAPQPTVLKSIRPSKRKLDSSKKNNKKRKSK